MGKVNFDLVFDDESKITFCKGADGLLYFITGRPSPQPYKGTRNLNKAERYTRRIFSKGETPEDTRQLDAIAAALGCLDERRP